MNFPGLNPANVRRAMCTMNGKPFIIEWDNKQDCYLLDDLRSAYENYTGNSLIVFDYVALPPHAVEQLTCLNTTKPPVV